VINKQHCSRGHRGSVHYCCLCFALVCHCRGVVAPRASKAPLTCARTTLCSSSPHRMSLSHFLLLLSWLFLQAVSAHPLASPPSAPRHKRDNSRNVPTLGFYDPRANGGSWLTVRLRLRLSPICVAKLIFLPIIRQLLIHQKNYCQFILGLFSKSTTPSQLALANRSTPLSSGHPTPRC
jgi:hypothetical protein